MVFVMGLFLAPPLPATYNRCHPGNCTLNAFELRSGDVQPVESQESISTGVSAWSQRDQRAEGSFLACYLSNKNKSGLEFSLCIAGPVDANWQMMMLQSQR